MTKSLAARAKKVIAIELDRGFVKYLNETISKIELLEGDVLASDTYHQLVDALQGRPYKLIANLPYQITSKVLRQFLESEPKPSQLIVMVQKEVAERMTAPPGQTSLLSLAVQVYSQTQLIQIVPKEKFHPQPQVDSAIVHCDLTQPDPDYQALTIEQQKCFWQIAKIGFAARRKQLKNNLGLEEQQLIDLNIPAKARAQELSIKQWCTLAQEL